MVTLTLEALNKDGLREFFKGLTKEVYPKTCELGMEYCLECGYKVWDAGKDAYDPNHFRSEEGKEEFHISQLCETCFDDLFREEG